MQFHPAKHRSSANGEVVVLRGIAAETEEAFARYMRPKMSVARAQPDGHAEGLFIAPPCRSATGDKWYNAASRRLSNDDGSFAGIVTAPLDQSYFTQLYPSINLGSNGSVLLLHHNGSRT